uniref:Uncharacterized protein n=1 Tax=Glossina austeni TaxID=7395 RepID=A0A1A9UJY5_GLOAU
MKGKTLVRTTAWHTATFRAKNTNTNTFMGNTMDLDMLLYPALIRFRFRFNTLLFALNATNLADIHSNGDSVSTLKAYTMATHNYSRFDEDTPACQISKLSC